MRIKLVIWQTWCSTLTPSLSRKKWDNVVLYTNLLPNPRLLYPPLSGHILSKLKMRHVIPNQLSLVLLRPTSTSHHVHISNPSQLLIRASVHLLFTCLDHLSLASFILSTMLRISTSEKGWKFGLLIWTWTTSWASFWDWVRPKIHLYTPCKKSPSNYYCIVIIFKFWWYVLIKQLEAWSRGVNQRLITFFYTMNET